MQPTLVKKRGEWCGLLSRALLFFFALLLISSCAARPSFTREELEARSRPAADPNLARLVDITLKHGYDLRDHLGPRTRYLMLERSLGEKIDRRYFEVEFQDGLPSSVFFLLNVGSGKVTRLEEYPERSREKVREFMAEEEARGGVAAPLKVDKTLMVKDAFAQKNGALMFSRGVVRLERTDIFGAAHEKGKLYRYFGQREIPVAASDMAAADREFDREVRRFLEAYD